MSKDGHVSLNDVSSYLAKRLNFNFYKDPWQQKYVKALIAPTNKTQAIFCNAEAGTGKTSLAISVAYYLLQKGKIDQILYVRSAVSIRDQGFLPGDIAEKEAPYMQPGLDALSKLDPNNKKLIETLIANKQLVIASTSFLRGVDWDGNKMLIVDEAQNMNLQELQTILTRPHDETKVVVIGSSLQCDEGLRAKRYNSDGVKLLPFQLYAEHFTKYTDIPVENIQLHKNYRGKFSQLADKIHFTVDFLDSPKETRGEKPSFDTHVSDKDEASAWEDLGNSLYK